MKRMLLFALVVLTGCGSVAPNSDVKQGFIGASGRTEVVADESQVAAFDTGPSVQDGGRRVFGTSCKNMMWDPAPMESNALALMKRQALEFGFNAVHSVQVRKDTSALIKNCWSAIVAEGVAFKADIPAQAAIQGQ